MAEYPGGSGAVANARRPSHGFTLVPNASSIICFQENVWAVNVAWLRPYDAGSDSYVQWHSTYAGWPSGETYCAVHDQYWSGNVVFADGHGKRDDSNKTSRATSGLTRLTSAGRRPTKVRRRLDSRTHRSFEQHPKKPYAGCNARRAYCGCTSS